MKPMKALEVLGSVDLDNSLFRKKGSPIESYKIVKKELEKIEKLKIVVNDMITYKSNNCKLEFIKDILWE